MGLCWQLCTCNGLSGGLRYNGPADTIFSLAALPDQNLKGAVGIAADFGGRAQARPPASSSAIPASPASPSGRAVAHRLARQSSRRGLTHRALGRAFGT